MKNLNIYSSGIFTALYRLSQKAFTLAEVLITLAIIGIVAAMTIPTLMQNYKRKQASVKLKRFYSMMQQAIQLSEIDNGSALYWNKEEMVYNEDGTKDSSASRTAATTFYNTYLRNYIKTAKIIESKGETIYVYLNDGSTFTIHNGDCTDIRYYINGYDANKTYTTGKDKFIFLLCNYECNSSYHNLTPNKAFGGWGSPYITTRDKALERCKADSYYCTVLLEIYDNWEFKNDYPYKL